MTVIVLDLYADKIHVDTKHSYSNGRPAFNSSKIQHLRGGIKVAMSGISATMSSIYKVLIDNSDYFTRANLFYTCEIPNSDAEGFMRAADGSIWWIFVREVDKKYTAEIQRILGPGELGHVYATGSGSAWFYAYFEEHKDVEKAFELTVKHCESCGGERQTF